MMAGSLYILQRPFVKDQLTRIPGTVPNKEVSCMYFKTICLSSSGQLDFSAMVSSEDALLYVVITRTISEHSIDSCPGVC
jgi:hypothetical protein